MLKVVANALLPEKFEDAHLGGTERRVVLIDVDGKFNLSRPKTDLEWVMYHAAKLPGPGQVCAAPPPPHLFPVLTGQVSSVTPY